MRLKKRIVVTSVVVVCIVVCLLKKEQLNLEYGMRMSYRVPKATSGKGDKAATFGIKSDQYNNVEFHTSTSYRVPKATSGKGDKAVTFFIKSDQYNNVEPIEFYTPKCVYSTDETTADVIYANIFQTKVQRHFPTQLWIGTFWESEANNRGRG